VSNKCIILFGPPLAGKGTISRMLKSHLDAYHLDMGNVLRSKLANDAELSKKLNSGVRLSNECVIQFFNDCFQQHKDQNLILDGFPRSVEQAQYLSHALSDMDVYVLELPLTLSELQKRAAQRVVCADCGTTSVVGAGECVCGAFAWYRRSDDNGDIPVNRYHDYCNYRESVLSFCAKIGTIIPVNGIFSAKALSAIAIRKITGDHI